LLREAYHVFRRQRAGILQRLGLSLSEYAALRLCARAPAMPSEIAEEAGVTSAGATDIIDRLEERRLVRRLSHPKDRRAVLVALTPSGRRLYKEAQSAQREGFRTLGRTMTETELEALLTGLAALVRSVPSPPT
jgi:DNA-binding MarR family transcriptional regulator